MKKFHSFVILFFTTLFCISPVFAQVEQWDFFELELHSQNSYPNPFEDVEWSAVFESENQRFEVDGFYDGEGVWKVRFMPNKTGTWTYTTRSNNPDLNHKTGSFVCRKPGKNNHGPVRVHNTFQLAYADGTPHFSIGTTCYAWVHQGDALEEQTLQTLKHSPFNKIRMCVFPKAYAYNKNEPELYAYQGKPPKDWDFHRFNPAFWRHFEKRLLQLRDLGIEADIILFHPYDRWGFKNMGHENNMFYLKYVVARFAAFRNVWWSLANEYDFLKWPMDHWDAYFQFIRQKDPYHHLRGIHNGRDWYDHTKEWVTHASLQTSHFEQAEEYRDRYQKPILFDECRYEGNIPQGWGNISAQQMTRNFWMGSLAGCYVGHGETYKHPQDILWWSKGGVLHGQSPARIQFMKDIIQALPYPDMKPDFSLYPEVYMFAQPEECYLLYFTQKKEVTLHLPGNRPYKLDGIDPWKMTVRPLSTVQPGVFQFTPPQSDYVIRLLPYAAGEKMRPDAKAEAHPQEGLVPLKVKFSTPWKKQVHWDFDDTHTSTERAPVHTFQQPGLHSVVLTITDENGVSASTTLPIRVDRDVTKPVVQVGFQKGNTPPVTLHGGKITRTADGGYDLGKEKPFSWIKVGERPVHELEGARSLTITGWLNAASMDVGSGGNRILFSLQYNQAGLDLVHLKNGSMRLAVNEWPDRIRNDSSPHKIQVGKWVFFAVTYDASRTQEAVCWYFGDENTPARLDCKTDYNNGPVGENSGDLVIGNFNKTLRGAGLDRQFRGQIRGLQIYCSYVGQRGVLSLDEIRRLQNMK